MFGDHPTNGPSLPGVKAVYWKVVTVLKGEFGDARAGGVAHNHDS